MTALDPIIAVAKAYAAARAATNEVRSDLAGRVRAAIRSRERALRNRIAEEEVAREELEAAIEAAPEQFAKPRTRAVDGVKFGLRKRPGKIAFADEGKVIAAIRKKFPDRVGALVRTKETVDKAALKKLPARELAMLGVTVVDPVDEVTIAVAESDADKLADAIRAFLPDEDDELEDAA